MWRHNSVGQRHFRQRSAVNVDFRPGQCEQGDGRYLRCGKDAVANSNYCEQHKGRGRKRPRESEEYRTTGAATMTPIIAASRMDSSYRFGQSSNHPVTDLNRMIVSEEIDANRYQAYMPIFSMPSSYLGLNYFGTMFTSYQPHPMVETFLLPGFGFVSTDSYLNLPASHIYWSQTWSDYSIVTWDDVQQTYMNPLSGSLPVSWPHWTTYYSPVPEYFRVVPFPIYLGWERWYLAATSSRPIGEAFIYDNGITTAPSSNLMTSIPTDNNNNAMTGEPDLRLELRPPLDTSTAAGSTSSANDTDSDNLWVDSLFSMIEPSLLRNSN